MNVRLIIGILVSIVAVEFIAIIVQLGKYKKVVNESIEYENFRKEVLTKASKERLKLQEVLEKQKDMQDKLKELNSKREKAK
ncbi:MAG: hypothetical protein ACLSW4_07105 [Clostridia bacterium]|jgi:hypothetical protein